MIRIAREHPVVFFFRTCCFGFWFYGAGRFGEGEGGDEGFLLFCDRGIIHGYVSIRFVMER